MCRWFAGGVMFSWLSPGLDAGRLDHLAPFIGFVGDKLSKVDRLANAAGTSIQNEPQTAIQNENKEDSQAAAK
jgi:hypothetical protein